MPKPLKLLVNKRFDKPTVRLRISVSSGLFQNWNDFVWIALIDPTLRQSSHRKRRHRSLSQSAKWACSCLMRDYANRTWQFLNLGMCFANKRGKRTNLRRMDRFIAMIMMMMTSG